MQEVGGSIPPGSTISSASDRQAKSEVVTEFYDVPIV